jgi:hypothetical protein
MHTRAIFLITVLGIAASAGCKKGPPPNKPAAHVPGTPHTDEVVTAWHNAGLVTEGFAPLQPPPNGAGYCEHGTVSGVDTVVCEYASDDALSSGITQVKEGWARVDVHTGVVLQTKHTTMAVVDRERREPSGKTISQMVKAFRRL